MANLNEFKVQDDDDGSECGGREREREDRKGGAENQGGEGGKTEKEVRKISCTSFGSMSLGQPPSV